MSIVLSKLSIILSIALSIALSIVLSTLVKCCRDVGAVLELMHVIALTKAASAVPLSSTSHACDACALNQSMS